MRYSLEGWCVTDTKPKTAPCYEPAVTHFHAVLRVVLRIFHPSTSRVLRRVTVRVTAPPVGVTCYTHF